MLAGESSVPVAEEATGSDRLDVRVPVAMDASPMALHRGLASEPQALSPYTIVRVRSKEIVIKSDSDPDDVESNLDGEIEACRLNLMDGVSRNMALGYVCKGGISVTTTTSSLKYYSHFSRIFIIMTQAMVLRNN